MMMTVEQMWRMADAALALVAICISAGLSLDAYRRLRIVRASGAGNGRLVLATSAFRNRMIMLMWPSALLFVLVPFTIWPRSSLTSDYFLAVAVMWAVVLMLHSWFGVLADRDSKRVMAMLEARDGVKP